MSTLSCCVQWTNVIICWGPGGACLGIYVPPRCASTHPCTCSVTMHSFPKWPEKTRGVRNSVHFAPSYPESVRSFHQSYPAPLEVILPRSVLFEIAVSAVWGGCSLEHGRVLPNHLLPSIRTVQSCYGYCCSIAAEQSSKWCKSW